MPSKLLVYNAPPPPSRRRWCNIKTTKSQCRMCAGWVAMAEPTIAKCWDNIALTVGQRLRRMSTMKQQWIKLWCLPENKRPRNNAVLMLGQRRRRWPNIRTPLLYRLLFAGLLLVGWFKSPTCAWYQPQGHYIPNHTEEAPVITVLPVLHKLAHLQRKVH